jgi:hypothetical protein
MTMMMSMCTESKNNLRNALTVHSVVCCVTRCGLVNLRNWCTQLVLLQKYIMMQDPMNIKSERQVQDYR